MIITLTEVEIKKALRDYIASLGFTGDTSAIRFTQTRNPVAITAELEVSPTPSFPEVGELKQYDAKASSADTGPEVGYSDTLEEEDPAEDVAAATDEPESEALDEGAPEEGVSAAPAEKKDPLSLFGNAVH